MPSLEPPTVFVTRDGSKTLRAPGDGEGYKSAAGALTEARHVYLEGSLVGSRLREGQPTRVLEVGFGAGLVFLATATMAQQHGTAVDYVSIEKRVPDADVLASLGYKELFAPSSLPEELIVWRSTLGGAADDAGGGAAVGKPSITYGGPVAEGEYSVQLGQTALTLLVGDALAVQPQGQFHAIYHDAFSPTTNPDLWSPQFLGRLSALLVPGGRLVSFSVAGPVRRALAECGLSVSKVPGPPGGKREVLVAERAP